ncbi:MAG: proline--tRNA ligase [Dehalococcoidia bacterium]|nr:proline--tRNA ligase [Dehalococcoidia bacterium]
MLFSKLFGKTLREAPADAENLSHQLLSRSGMIDQTASGVYSYLPLGWRVLRKVEQIIREELDQIGGQELLLPALQPIELWEATGRLLSFGKTLFTVNDRRERTLVLGPTHEEVITDLIHHQVQSYRQLPLLLYQIQNKFRDEPRPRGGLLRVREFIMKDMYSFDVDEAALDESYQKTIEAYYNIYRRCGLQVVMVEADSGAIGGKDSHEFMLIAETGEDQIVRCGQCHYAANIEKANFCKESLPQEDPLPMEEVSTLSITTIADLASFLDVPISRTLKAIFYAADGVPVLVLIRGDLDVNGTKLKNLLKCTDLRMAVEAELESVGIVSGFASPIGLKDVRVVADDSIATGGNFIAGANKVDTHLKNVNYPRDFQVDMMADVAQAETGHGCPRCGTSLLATNGIEVGHVFKLGTFFSETLDATFLDDSSVSRPMVMGCYGIGLGRLLAAAVEHNHDEKGITWPVSIAPYHVYLCALSLENREVADAAEEVYAALTNEGVEILFDDRLESPGIKFNDADLLGIPIRITISPRTLKFRSAEIKRRADKEFQLIPLDETVGKLKQLLDQEAASD